MAKRRINYSKMQMMAFEKAMQIYGEKDGRKFTEDNRVLLIGHINKGINRKGMLKDRKITIKKKYGVNSPKYWDTVSDQCIDVCQLILDGDTEKASTVMNYSKK